MTKILNSKTDLGFNRMLPKKSLGQNFLQCAWVADAMLEAAHVSAKDTVLEIGPGMGALTRPLAARAKKIIAVEKDEMLARSLKNALTQEHIENVSIIEGDIRKLFPHSLPIPDTYKVIANIPYYLTSYLLRLLLESKQKPHTIALTIQKEVAERACAKAPHTNLLALSIQAYGTPQLIKIVPAGCFLPKPKVDSAILLISDISDIFFKKNHITEDDFFTFIRKAFGQKRKTLANNLASVSDKSRTFQRDINHHKKNFYSILSFPQKTTGFSGKVRDKKHIGQILEKLRLPPDVRPEAVPLALWARIMKNYEH